MRLRHRLLWALVPLAVVTLGAPFANSSALAQSKPPRYKQTIHVSAATVLCLAQKGFQPSGKPIAAKGKRPAGVAVFGVAGLGIGVREGDVVTEILGQPVRSPAQGIALILAARAAQRPTITGTIWRQAQPIGVTVEQPYTTPDCDAQDAECWKAQCLEQGKPKRKSRPAKPASSAAK